MNKTILLGRLTKEPEIRVSQKNNTKVAKFTLAVNRKYVAQGEERQADFINIVAYSKLAEFVEKYLSKGLQICVSGRIQTRVWSDDNGMKHYVTEVISEEISFADSQRKTDNNTVDTSNIPIEEDTNSEIMQDDDLPF